MTGGVAANHGNSVPSRQHEAWVACRALLPHARKVLGYALGLAEEMVDRATIANNMAWYLLMGEHAAAEEVGCCAMMAREKVLRPEHSDTLISVSNLGSVLERRKRCGGEHWEITRRCFGRSTHTRSPTCIAWHYSSINSSSIPLHLNCISERIMGIQGFLVRDILLPQHASTITSLWLRKESLESF